MTILLSICCFLSAYYLSIKFNVITKLHKRLIVTDTYKTVNPGQMPGFIKILLISNNQAVRIMWYSRFSHFVNILSWVYIYTTYKPFSIINMVRLETIFAFSISCMIMMVLNVYRWKILPINPNKLDT
jgi:hypothetical protein